jgi:nitrogen fixation NifU-like protein
MDLADLYRDVIVDHNRSPRNRGRLPDATHRADGDNPLCGDRLHLDLALDGDVIRDLRFDGSGCAISTASASLMGEAVKGRTRAAALAGVREFPARVKCASLCWHTLNAALAGGHEPVTTE